MILRIFATDGFTPESIFRWSVDETAEHLCEKQLLWVTRLDGPWRPLVEWFMKHSSYRGVMLDPSNLWEWYREHEVTWRIAQGMYFHSEDDNVHQDTPEAVCWIHDDMAPPSGSGFKNDVKEWLASTSTSLEAPAYMMWDSFNSVRADGLGKSLAGEVHCWMAKWSNDLCWMEEKNTPKYDLEWFKPLGAVSWTCPYPFRHAKGVDKDFRDSVGYARKHYMNRFESGVHNPTCIGYDPNMTWERFKKVVGT